MKLASVILLLLLAACSDPAGPRDPDPCEADFACLSPGIDLEVVSLEVLYAETDPETMLGIVWPDAVQVRYKVRNRGSRIAPEGQIYISFNASQFTGYDYATQLRPALAPGEEHQTSVTVSMNQLEASRLKDDRVALALDMWDEADTLRADNRLVSSLFHLAVPLLDVTFTTTSSIKVGDALQLGIVARNYGKHADAPARTLTACLYDIFRGCRPEYKTTIGGFSMPSVPAGTEVQFTATMTMPASAAWQDAASRYTLYLCDAPSTGAQIYFTDYGFDCYSRFRSIHVAPDYEAVCAPPRLVPGAGIVLSTYNCGIRPTMAGFESETQHYRFHIVALDATAGTTYELQRSNQTAIMRLYNGSGLPIHDFDAAAERIRVAEAGRVYIVMYSPTEALSIEAAVVATGAV